MSFAPHHMNMGVEAQGEMRFTMWTYATNDTLEDVLRPNYFLAMLAHLRPGDLILFGSSPRPQRSPWANRAAGVRRALLMVTRATPGKGVTVRLVQDYGGPDDPPAAPLEPARPRGRPRKEPAEAGS